MDFKVPPCQFGKIFRLNWCETINLLRKLLLTIKESFILPWYRRFGIGGAGDWGPLRYVFFGQFALDQVGGWLLIPFLICPTTNGLFCNYVY